MSELIIAWIAIVPTMLIDSVNLVESGGTRVGGGVDQKQTALLLIRSMSQASRSSVVRVSGPDEGGQSQQT